MKNLFLFPALLATALLCGCPDTKVPQTPPSVPQPKLASLSLPLALAPHAHEGFAA